MEIYETHYASTLPREHRKLIVALIAQFPFIKTSHVMSVLAAKDDLKEMPGKSAVYRYISAWKKENAGLFLYLTNPDAWKRKTKQRKDVQVEWGELRKIAR